MSNAVRMAIHKSLLEELKKWQANGLLKNISGDFVSLRANKVNNQTRESYVIYVSLLWNTNNFDHQIKIRQVAYEFAESLVKTFNLTLEEITIESDSLASTARWEIINIPYDHHLLRIKLSANT